MKHFGINVNALPSNPIIAASLDNVAWFTVWIGTFELFCVANIVVRNSKGLSWGVDWGVVGDNLRDCLEDHMTFVVKNSAPRPRFLGGQSSKWIKNFDFVLYIVKNWKTLATSDLRLVTIVIRRVTHTKIHLPQYPRIEKVLVFSVLSFHVKFLKQ